MTIDSISIDLETFSDVDLSKAGIYKYAQSPLFRLLLFAYAINDGEVNVVDVQNGEQIPEYVLQALSDPNVIKWAFNASFERICLSEWLKKNHPEHFSSYSNSEDTVSGYLDPASWRCTMTWAAYMGLPMSLAGAGAVLGLDAQKMTEGKELIRYFCCPCKPTKTNGGRSCNLPHHAPDKWATFKEYNKRDVEVEQNIQRRLTKYPVPEFVWDEYHLSEEVNDRGILVDMDLVRQAVLMNERSTNELQTALQEITNLENPNSVLQMKEWLSQNGLVVESLGKKQVAELIKTAPANLRKVLELRQISAKSSIKKYVAMETAVCEDSRARGMFMFYGASRSGRFSGRIIQLQNLPQTHLPDLEVARQLVKDGMYDTLSVLYDSVPEVLSELIRTAFIPKPGYKFIVADFSAIEARVLSWLAGQEWRMEIFANGGDIYCATASRMFHCKVEKHGENAELRQKGKQAELGCGYGGGVGALKSMGALEMGIPEDELPEIVDAWRNANPKIVSFWYSVDRAAKKAIMQKTTTEVNGIKFICKNAMLFIELPSGRRLSYVKPKMGMNRFGSESITYEGTNGTTKKWERIETFGGKLTENIVQAIARDLLCYAMKTLSYTYMCAHVHDEIIIECSPDVSVDAICKQMSRTPSWAKGLVLNADGFECDFYKKD